MLCVILWATPARPDSGILRIPLAHVAREHLQLDLSSDADDELSVVTLNAPLSIISFDNTMRNETELFFFKPAPSRFNTSNLYNARHHNGEAIVAGVLPVTVRLSYGGDILVGVELVGGCGVFETHASACPAGWWDHCNSGWPGPALVYVCRHDSRFEKGWASPREARWREYQGSNCMEMKCCGPRPFALYRYPAGLATFYIIAHEACVPAASAIVLLPSAPASIRKSHSLIWFYSEDLVIAAGLTVGVVALACSSYLVLWRRQQRQLRRELQLLDEHVRVATFATSLSPCPTDPS